ncbi:uncharacterized protein LOC113497445 [Trichoplusia ni]|uniref:Uncharacterized protein LOC113497445 n=1 Tax=Trichoplusia ni TaxID=7111 RepID=A0A7E5VWU2_TRINI|nr:uncharacterized protein LOC113497445 [Trichoplusia ni]
MLVRVLFAALFLNCKCANITIGRNQRGHQNLIKCITSTIKEYFTTGSSVAYVDMNPDDDELLRGLHSTATVPLVLRLPTARLPVSNSGYLITARTVEAFCNGFKDMLRDFKWNPSARILIVIKSLKQFELKTIFDVLLKQHVINVVVVNGTDDALLYTYNPFDHYGCGRNYKHVEALGPCLQTDTNLFPNKLVTGLRNCTLRASVPHRPPFAINPARVKKGTKMGAEQYALQLITEPEEIKVKYTYDFDFETYTTITPDSEIDGPLDKLNKGEADVMFGSAMVVLSRIEAFTFITGYLDVNDEILFLVKRSENVPAWKVLYLVFQPSFSWISLNIRFLLADQPNGPK